MKKYDLVKRTAEIKYKDRKEIEEGCTAFDDSPEYIKTFDTLEKAKRNVMINKAGGTSGKNTKNYRISIPVGMIKALGVTEDDRSVVLEEKDGVITIKKEKSTWNR